MTEPIPPRRGPNWISIFFAGLAVILFAIALWLARPLLPGGNVVVAPTAIAGSLQAVHVTNALTAQGLTVEQNQGFIPRGVFSVPGQGVTVDGVPLYIFIFPDAEQPAAELTTADTAALGPRGTPVAGVEPAIFSRDNIIVALFDAPDDVRTKVEQAISGLP